MDSQKQIVFIMCIAVQCSFTLAVPRKDCCWKLVLPTEKKRDTIESFKQLQHTKHVRRLEIEVRQLKLKLSVPKNGSHATVNVSTFYNVSCKRSAPFPMFLVWANSRKEPLISMISSPTAGSETDLLALYSLGTLSRSVAQTTVTFSAQMAKCEPDQNKTKENDLQNWVASEVLRVLAQTKGTVCYPRQGAFHCCEARSGNSKVICNLKPSNGWLFIYFNISVGLWLCIACSWIGVRVLALAISFWLPSTRTSEEGMRLLEPDNISPVGLRSMISYHFIPTGNSLFDILKRFLIMAFALTFPISVLLVLWSLFGIRAWVVYTYYRLGPKLSVYLIAVCFLHIALSIFMSFCCLYESPGRCGMCRLAGVKPRLTVTEEIKHHFYLQREYFKKFYRMFSYLVSLLATSSTSRFKFVVFSLLLCLWVPLLLTILCCLFIIQFILATDPILVFVNFLKPRYSVLNGSEVALKIYESVVLRLFWFTFSTLIYNAFLDISLITIFTLLGITSNLIDFLPYITLALLVLLYLLSNYRSFTNTYLNLKLQLFDVCMKQDELKQNDIEQGNIKKTVYFDDQHVPGIPKEVFDFACKEILPKGRAVSLMLFKQITIFIFMFLIFLCIMAYAQPMGIDPIVQAFVAIVTGSLPKILSFLSRSKRERRIEELRLNNGLQDIVKRYALGNDGPNNQDWTSNETEEEVIDLC